MVFLHSLLCRQSTTVNNLLKLVIYVHWCVTFRTKLILSLLYRYTKRYCIQNYKFLHERLPTKGESVQYRQKPEEIKVNTNRETLRIYWRHAWRYKLYVIGMLGTLPFAVLIHQVLPPLIAANILSKLADGGFTRDTLWENFGTDLLLYFGLITLGGTIIFRIVIYCAWKMEGYTTRDLHRTMFNHLMSLDSDFHANSFGGSLVSRANKLVGSFFKIYETIVFQFYTLFIMFTFTAIIIWPKSPQFVIALFFMSAAFIVMTFFATKRVRTLNDILAKKENKQTGYLADMVTNVMAVKSYSAKSFEKQRFEQVSDDVRQSVNDVMRASLLREMYFGSVTTAIQAVALTLAVIGVVVFNAEIGLVFLIVSYTNNMTVRLWDFAQSGLKNLNRGFGDAQEATQTLLRKPTIIDPENPQKLDLSRPTVAFENIQFSHDKTVLFTDFSLELPAGKTVGLVGHSGSGKTTLTSLLLRFKDVNGGQITINGTDIREVTQDELRAAVSYVPQEPLLFHRTLSENISYGKPDASHNDIVAAAKKANAHEFIEKLELGYDTLVGERGIKLSGGQKQRVAIARAMLKDAPILVLDEATSALDSESEQLIQDALWKLMKGRTAIVIAHRLSTIQRMDSIVVLDNGKIIEQGPHAQLIAKKGQYAKLWKHQSGGFLQD
jgi:ATP-binding cassette subfamily B protein